MACSRMPKWRFRPPGCRGFEVAGAGELERGLVGRARDRPSRPGTRECSARARSAPRPRRRARRCPWGRRESSAGCGPIRRAARAAASGRSRRRARGIARGRRRTAPPSARRAAAPRAPMPASKCCVHPVGHEELGILRPAIGALGEPDLVLAQRFAVGRGGVDLVRRAVADVAVEDDQGRPALGLAEDRERILDPLEVIGVADPQHVPVDSRGSAPRHPR